MAKAISESEGLLANKEAELAALKEEARNLELYDAALEHGKELDGTAYAVLPVHVLCSYFSSFKNTTRTV